MSGKTHWKSKGWKKDDVIVGRYYIGHWGRCKLYKVIDDKKRLVCELQTSVVSSFGNQGLSSIGLRLPHEFKSTTVYRLRWMPARKQFRVMDKESYDTITLDKKC